MLLFARTLGDVQSVNSFGYVDQVELTEGDAVAVYLQLHDKSRSACPPADPFSFGQRYCASSGAVLRVTMDHVDDARKITRVATQPFAQDASIWRFDLLATDKLKGTVSLRLELTEGIKITKGSVVAALRILSAGV